MRWVNPRLVIDRNRSYINPSSADFYYLQSEMGNGKAEMEVES